MLISDGEEYVFGQGYNLPLTHESPSSEWYAWHRIVEVIGGKSSNITESLENLEQVDDENTQTELNSRVPSTTEENIAQPGVRDALSSAFSLVNPPPTAPLVFEYPDPAPWPLTSSVRQIFLPMVVETGVQNPTTTRRTSKAESKPKSTAPTSVPTLVPALELPSSRTEALASLRCFICASPSVEYLLPLRHQPRWDLGACKHPQTYGTWEAHRECALLIDETVVSETPGRIRGQVEYVRSIDPERFKLVCLFLRPPPLAPHSTDRNVWVAPEWISGFTVPKLSAKIRPVP